MPEGPRCCKWRMVRLSGPALGGARPSDGCCDVRGRERWKEAVKRVEFVEVPV